MKEREEKLEKGLEEVGGFVIEGVKEGGGMGGKDRSGIRNVRINGKRYWE